MNNPITLQPLDAKSTEKPLDLVVKLREALNRLRTARAIAFAIEDNFDRADAGLRKKVLNDLI